MAEVPIIEKPFSKYDTNLHNEQEDKSTSNPSTFVFYSEQSYVTPFTLS